MAFVANECYDCWYAQRWLSKYFCTLRYPSYQYDRQTFDKGRSHLWDKRVAQNYGELNDDALIGVHKSKVIALQLLDQGLDIIRQRCVDRKCWMQLSACWVHVKFLFEGLTIGEPGNTRRQINCWLVLQFSETDGVFFDTSILWCSLWHRVLQGISWLLTQLEWEIEVEDDH